MSINCNDVKTIKEVTDQVDYEDENPQGKGDSKWVSCGQSKGYNELKDKYNNHFDFHNEDYIAKKMCRCCKKLKPKGTEKVSWKEFYQCMKQSIIFPDTKLGKVLNKLILKP